ncbi:hypothetical protein ACMC56_16020 [Campylobacterota bacterium DY0563]
MKFLLIIMDNTKLFTSLAEYAKNEEVRVCTYLGVNYLIKEKKK